MNAYIAERGGHFQHLISHCFLFSDFNVIYFLTNRAFVRTGLRDFSITLYSRIHLGPNQASAPRDSNIVFHALFNDAFTTTWVIQHCIWDDYV
jgi:hypothetical protein